MLINPNLNILDMSQFYDDQYQLKCRHSTLTDGQWPKFLNLYSPFLPLFLPLFAKINQHLIYTEGLPQVREWP